MNLLQLLSARTFRRSPRVGRRKAPLRIEPLETRTLLAIDTYHNEYRPRDVDADGIVTPLDALIIINSLNAATGGGSSSAPTAAALTSGDGGSQPFYTDVDADGIVTPLDALLVINTLNADGDDLVAIRLATTDLAGNPITQINAGDDFQLRVYVQDLRATPQGVIAGYLDIEFDAALAQAVGMVVHVSPYTTVALGTIATNMSGVTTIDEAGGTDFLTSAGGAEVLLFHVQMTAQGGGMLTFAGNPADGGAPVYVLLKGISAGIDHSQVYYSATSIDVIPAALPTVSIGNATAVVEGDSGATAMEFTVTLSAASASTVTVDFASASASATSGADFTAVAGTLTFLPGETSKTILVDILGDTIDESDESLLVTLSDASGATIGTAAGTGTITDDDDTPTVSLAGNVSVVEGNAGTTALQFTVQLDFASPNQVTVDFATLAGTATAGVDYESATGTLTFLPGETSKLVTINVLGDTIDEGDEAFSLELSNNAGAILGTALATGTIQDDDGAPQVSIVFDGAANEGNAGQTPLTFTVALANASSQTVTVDFATAAGTAAAGVDFENAAGTLTFLPGETSKTITVNALGDALDEIDETFTVTLSNAANATIATAAATGTILDDDDPPTIAIADASLSEGNSGTTLKQFTVTLSAASGKTVTVDYATAPGTAVAGPDYLTKTGAVTFLPGETSKMIEIEIVGDTTNEPNETFLVNLSNPTNATIADAQATGTILDDGDPQPALSISDAAVLEGDAGTKTLEFTVSLSAVSGRTVAVEYMTFAGTATQGVDYQNAVGILNFAPGETSKTVSVTINGDTDEEDDESFEVRLQSAINATVADGVGAGQILDDDSVRIDVVAINNVTEGNSGTQTITFHVQLSKAATTTVTVDYATVNGTATAGQDYQAKSGAVTFAPGVVSQFVTVNVIGDVVDENDETFTFQLSNATGGAKLGTSSATGQIIDDDTLPLLTIADVTQNEGNSGTTAFVFTVTLSQASSQQVTVEYTTVAQTATAGADYAHANGTLVFAPGETSKTITVNVNGDVFDEDNETFQVTLFSPVNAVLQNGSEFTGDAIGTITDDDPTPSIGISPASVVEGDSGTKALVFNVALSSASGKSVTVDYATVAGTATQGTDYQAATGTVTFAPGETVKTITVQIVGDDEIEADETLQVNLSNAANATIGMASANGLIVNDDFPFTPGSVRGFVYADVDNDGFKDGVERALGGVTVMLEGTDFLGSAVMLSTKSGVDGSYLFDDLVPGSYMVRQIQPAFFIDGKDTWGNGQFTSPHADHFDIELDSGEDLAGYNFGERGLRPEFITKRMFMGPLPASGIVSGIQFAGGELWFAFDAAFAGNLSAQIAAADGRTQVQLELYDATLNLLATGGGGGQAKVDWHGRSEGAYLLRVTGLPALLNLLLTTPTS